MKSQNLKIMNETGFHARAASEFVRLATKQDCEVYIEKDGRQVTAKSILGVLSLAIAQGSIVKISTDGADEEASLEKLVEFVEAMND